MKRLQCVTSCYASLRKGGKNRLFESGEVVEVNIESIPETLKGKFIDLGDKSEGALDLKTATKEQLMEETLSFADLKKEAESFGYDLVKGSKKKEALISEFVEERDHAAALVNPNTNQD